MFIKKAKSLRGSIVVPGDKSISHRAAIIASMADGRSYIENFADGEDCGSTIRCLRQLGVAIERNGNTLLIDGVGKCGFRRPEIPLDCANSGTTMRLLAGVLAGQEFESVLIGDESLRRRPMARIIEPLTMMGAQIGSEIGFPPLRIRGRNPLNAIRYELPVASSQLKSCILLAGLNANGGTTVSSKQGTRDHTERMLRLFGADVEYFDRNQGEQSVPARIRVLGDSELKAIDTKIPGDISSAVFFIAAAAALNGSRLEIHEVGVNFSRTEVITHLRSLGADIDVGVITNADVEPSADITVRGRMGLIPNAGSNLIDGNQIPGIIDEIPMLAVLGTQIEGGIEIRDAGELRIKETDRIAAIVENLRRMGTKVTEFNDGLRVERSKLSGAVVDSFGDHRIAMAFAVAGLLAEGETEIENAECISVSFPAFFETLQSVVR